MVTDNELLGKYFFKNDPAAFEELVRRHSNLVMGVCRGMLLQTQDAEDAFQATFLILSRKSKSLLNHGSIAGWLYQTAVRNCLQVRRRKSRIKETEMTEDPIKSDEPWEAIAQAQEEDLVYQEINRLPKRYRDAIVLCHLNGHSRSEAAELLDSSESAIKAALARGRNMLRRRLIRSGIFTSAILATLKATTLTAKEHVSESLITSAIQHCQGVSSTTTTVGTSSQFVQSLASQGVMSMNTAIILKSGALAATLFLAVAVPITVYAQHTKVSSNGKIVFSPGQTGAQSPTSDLLISNEEPNKIKIANSINQSVGQAYATDRQSKTTESNMPPVRQQMGMTKNSASSNSRNNQLSKFQVENSKEYWQLMKDSYKLRTKSMEEWAINDTLSSSEALNARADSFEFQAKAIEAELNIRRIEFEEANPISAKPIQFNNQPYSLFRNQTPQPNQRRQALEQNLIVYKKSLAEFQATHGTSHPDGKHLINAIKHVEQELRALETTGASTPQARNRMSMPQRSVNTNSPEKSASQFWPALNSSVTQTPRTRKQILQDDLLKYESQLAELSSKYGNGHIDVRNTQDKIEVLREEIQAIDTQNIPPASTTPVSPGEALTIETWDETLSRRVVVQADHTISLPRIGTLSVKGMTTDLVAERLNEKFSKFIKDPDTFVGREIATSPLSSNR